MITKEQHTTIRQYLFSKKLPIDILVEIQEHFINQITAIMIEKHWDFDQAFAETQESWQHDLELYWDGSWDLHDRNNLSKTTANIQFSAVFRVAVLGGILGLAMLFLLAKTLSYNHFSHLFFVALSFVFCVPIIYYFSHYKAFRLAKKYDNYILTNYQNYMLLSIILVNTFPQIIFNRTRVTTLFYEISTSFSAHWYPNIFVLLGVAIAIASSVFVMISNYRYLQQIEKIQPFLQYLKPSN